MKSLKMPNTIRIAIAGTMMAVVALTAATAQANCGGCGDKKECPSPTPAPSPAK
jgi:hypothetical protein